jgi:phage tail-like protein
VPQHAPQENFNFRVEIDGLASTAFSEVVVPDAWTEVVEYREGSEALSSGRLVPGRVHYGNVVLRRGISESLELYRWFDAVRRGQLERRNVMIILEDGARQAIRRWLVHNAWPARYAGPTLNGQGNDVVIEEIELAHGGIEIDAS